MQKTNETITIFQHIAVSGRILLATMLICSVLYPLVILSVGQTLTPYTANGSLLEDEHGQIIGSELIAQKFSRPEYFWPRPSAVDYNASSTGGSNLSPTNPALHERAKTILAQMGVKKTTPLPADLATASGSGVDPHITLSAAHYQAERVAAARGIPTEQVTELLEPYAKSAGEITFSEPLVNVLLVNRALDNLSVMGIERGP